MSGTDRGSEVGLPTVQPGEQGHLDARLAQLQAGGNLEDGKGFGSALDRGLGEPQHPVSVCVRLDGDHAAGRCGGLGEEAHIVAERREVEEQGRGGAHRATRSTRAPRPAVSCSGWRSVAVAQSSVDGAPDPGSPNKTASEPSSGVSSPHSTTN